MGFRLRGAWVAVALLTVGLGGCKNNSAGNIPVITTQPTAQTVTVPAAATFSVVASGPGTLLYQWYLNGVAIVGANAATYTTPLTTITQNGEDFFAFVSNDFGSVESDEVSLTVNGQTTPMASMVTLGNDPGRTGVNPVEPILTPGNVNANSFGRVGVFSTDANVSAQPLYLSNVNVPSVGERNIVYAATAGNGVYAFDAGSGATLWHANLNAANETSADALSCNASAASIGISSTPVIDPLRGAHGAIYVVTMSKTSTGAYVQRIHALDAATGNEMFGGPAEITAGNSSLRVALNSANAGKTNFDPSRFAARAGLVLAGNQVFASFAPLCGATTDRGWIMAFDAGNLRTTGSLNLAAANSSSSATEISSGSFAADAGGNIFAEGIAAGGAGNALLRIATSGGLALANSPTVIGSAPNNSFARANTTNSSITLLPDVTEAAGHVLHLALTADSEGDIFLLNRDALAPSSSASAYQQIAGALSGTGSYPVAAYFNQTAFFAGTGDRMKAFTLSNARLAGIPSMESVSPIASAPAGISISANGTRNAIAWVTESGSANEPAILHAFDAVNLSREIYNSSQAAKDRDAFGANISSVAPTIANGRVFIATPAGIAVFGSRQ